MPRCAPPAGPDAGRRRGGGQTWIGQQEVNADGAGAKGAAGLPFQEVGFNTKSEVGGVMQGQSLRSNSCYMSEVVGDVALAEVKASPTTSTSAMRPKGPSEG